MKFAIAVVMFVCALAGAQASWAAIAPGVSYVNSVAHAPAHWGGAWNGAWNNGAWNGWNGAWNNGAWNNGAWNHGAWGAPAAVAVHASAPWGLTAPGWHGGVPGIALAQGPHLAGAHGHEGVYVAKTRGAVHTAPLAGHIASATSVNVAPAPGTL